MDLRRGGAVRGQEDSGEDRLRDLVDRRIPGPVERAAFARSPGRVIRSASIAIASPKASRTSVELQDAAEIFPYDISAPWGAGRPLLGLVLAMSCSGGAWAPGSTPTSIGGAARYGAPYLFGVEDGRSLNNADPSSSAGKPDCCHDLEPFLKRTNSAPGCPGRLLTGPTCTSCSTGKARTRPISRGGRPARGH